MNDLAFFWEEAKAVQLPPKLTLPQFKILGYKLNSCTKKYNTGKNDIYLFSLRTMLAYIH